MHASRPQVESRGHKVDVPGTIRPTICLRDGPTEGRHDKTRRKARRKEKKMRRKEKKRNNEISDTELEKANEHFCVQLVGQGRHKRPEGRKRWRGKNDNNNDKREKQTSLKTKQTQTQGGTADAEMQSTGVLSTWQGTGQHSK